MSLIKIIFNSHVDFEDRRLKTVIENFQYLIDNYDLNSLHGMETSKKSILASSILFGVVIVIPLLMMLIGMIVSSIDDSYITLLSNIFTVKYDIITIIVVVFRFVIAYLIMHVTVGFIIALLLVIATIQEEFISIAFLKTLEYKDKEEKHLICNETLKAEKDRL